MEFSSKTMVSCCCGMHQPLKHETSFPIDTDVPCRPSLKSNQTGWLLGKVYRPHEGSPRIEVKRTAMEMMRWRMERVVEESCRGG
jgi:hypothetical protein